MTVKMKFPDGTEIEGEVKEIAELMRQLKDLIGDFKVPGELEKHK